MSCNHLSDCPRCRAEVEALEEEAAALDTILNPPLDQLGCGPCPFCGAPAQAEFDEDHHGCFYNLGCSDPGCIAHYMYYTESTEERPFEEAVQAWNRRAVPHRP